MTKKLLDIVSKQIQTGSNTSQQQNSYHALNVHLSIHKIHIWHCQRAVSMTIEMAITSSYLMKYAKTGLSTQSVADTSNRCYCRPWLLAIFKSQVLYTEVDGRKS